MKKIFAIITKYRKNGVTEYQLNPQDHKNIFETMLFITQDLEISIDAASWCELATIGETYTFREGCITIKEV